MKKSNIKVLIVDDDKASGNLLSEVVKRMGFKPLVSTRPNDALNIAKLQSVQAAIIDVLLPKMSGVDLAIEMRRTRFGDAPIILVSGVFKDKMFASESIAKTKAADFLFKPYGAEELMQVIHKALGHLADSEKWTAKSLMTHNFKSTRETAKAIENLETINGPDFPYILSILMSGGISGSLNIVNNAGEIYGVTLTAGSIENVDSVESNSTAILALISNGFLAQSDWDSLQADGKKKLSPDDLIREGFVSPHAVAVAKKDQIFADIRTICNSETVQVNFARGEDGQNAPQFAVHLPELVEWIFSSKEDFFDQDYLIHFYSGTKDAPLRLNCEPDQFTELWHKIENASALTALRSAIEGGGTLSGAIAAQPELELEVYKVLHRLVLSRAVLFDDVQRVKTLTTMLERFRSMHSELMGKPADEVFAYFGVEDRLTPAIAEKIFEEYSRSNHPSQLPKDSPKELMTLCQECFQIVSDAKSVIVDDEKREALLLNRKKQSNEKSKKAGELTLQGLDLLRKGKFKQASEILEQAKIVHPSSLQMLIKIWADVKGGVLKEKSELMEALKALEALPRDDRKSPYYFMALGLVKRGLGDQTAQAQFERALQLDSSFIEASRELNSASNKGARDSKDHKLDLLTGDITEVVSQLFRRKAD